MNTPTIYSAAGNGVVKADQHGELVLLSDYLELKRQHDILDKKEEVQYSLRGALAEELKKAKAEIEELRGNPDPLTAYLYAAELCKDDIKTLKDEVKRLTLLQVGTLDERNKAEAKVERLRKAGDAMAEALKDGGIIVSGYILADDWFKAKHLTAKEGKQS